MSILSRWRTKTKLEAALKEQLPMLGRIVASYEADQDLQQELLQEVVIAAWQASERFEERANVKTYFARIAHNRCATHISKAVNRPMWHGGEDPDLMASQQSLEQAASLEQLQAQIRALPLKPRQVITLFLEGFSYDEIADVCELSQSNVGVIINRAKTQLAQFFSEGTN